MLTHTIRLAGPWELTVDGRDDPVCVRLPFALPDDTRTAQLTRRFHRPAGLTVQTVVRIEIGLNDRLRQLDVNGTQIPVIQPDIRESATGWISAFDLTTALLPFNVLQIELAADTGRPSEIQSAVLVIVEP